MTAIAVIGVPRSGTSLTCSILKELGVFMGERWVELLEDWQPGFSYQDAEFLELHENIAKYRQEHKELIAKRNKEHSIWGLSNHCLPFIAWKEFIEDCPGIHVIRMARSLDSSISSYATRSNMCVSDAKQLIEPFAKIILDIEYKFVGNLLKVCFDDLIDFPQQTIENIAAFIRLPMKTSAIQIVQYAWRRF